jgi:anti-sigma regulatory factor (Ser/Thr protein kinase)
MVVEHRTIVPITIHNPQGEAYRAVAMGRRSMMFRELLKNAEEAAIKKPQSERQVRIYATHVEDTSKLSIWNRGGMTLSMLQQFVDINVQLDKINDLDRNYGRGAKIAGMMSNQLGMRYRSCVNGRVLQTTLAVDSENRFVGPIEVENPLSGAATIEDVTRDYTDGRQHPSMAVLKRSGVQQNLLSIDWTEVTLLGNDPAQDTTH